jgi:endoglucanase
MKSLSLNVLLFVSFAACMPAADQPAAAPAAAPSVWPEGGMHRVVPNPKAVLLTQISVKGNRFVDASGEPVLFRGLSIADPDKLQDEGRWNRELFAAVKDTGANLVRLPVHPSAWRKRGKQAYLELLDQAVDWCTDLGMHVIIDWHSIGNLQSGMFQDPMYNTTKEETFDFWRTAARHFHGHHTVAFYELFNEPTHFGGMLGTMSWTEWRILNEEMIGIIRYSDKQTIPLVAGFDWAYDLTPLRYEPVRAEGIGYVTHPYPNKRGQPWEPRWEEDYAFAADRFPLIATEIGFELKPGEVVDDNHYGNRITRFLEERGISWMAWVFDPSWTPRMLKSFDGFELAGDGEFFKQAMHRPAAPLLAKPGG